MTERGLWQCRCATAEGAKRRRSGGSAETAPQRITDGRVAQRASVQCLAARRFVPRSCWLELSRRDNRFLVALGRASVIPAGRVPSLVRRLTVSGRRRGVRRRAAMPVPARESCRTVWLSCRQERHLVLAAGRVVSAGWRSERQSGDAHGCVLNGQSQLRFELSRRDNSVGDAGAAPVRGCCAVRGGEGA